MKRFMSLALVFVLVLSLGAISLAAEKSGSLPLSGETGVSIKILEYARIWFNDQYLFGTLLGEPGLYTSDEWQVIENAEEYFKGKGWQAPEEWHGYNRSGGTLFNIESNCNANVDVSFAWDNEEQTLNSELVFFVYNHKKDQPTDYTPVKGNAANSMLFPEGEALTFEHKYVNDPKGVQYKIGGAIFIDYISQQMAGEYKGTITVTVASAQIL